MTSPADEPKCGLDDAFAAGLTRRDLEAQIVDILPDTGPDWREPLPLDEPAGPPFPAEILPSPLGTYVAAVAEATQTPPDLAGIMALGTLSAAARGRYAVQLPEHDWEEPLVLQAVAFARSGERKSAVVAELTRPLVSWERERHLKDEQEIQEWHSRHRVLRKQLEAAEAAASKRRELRERGSSPQDLDLQRQAAARELADHEKLAMYATRVVAHDITPEMAKQIIVEQGGALAIIEAEGTFFSVFAGRYTDGRKSPPIEVMLTGHAAEPITVDRKSGPALHTPRGHLTIAVACQPHVAEAMGAVDGFRERGGAARILPAFPSSRVGDRALTAPAVPEALRATWVACVRGILDHQPARPTDAGGFPLPCRLRLAPEAYAAFQQFRTWHEPQLRWDGSMGDFSDWGSKLPGAVLRIAGLLHLATHPVPDHAAISADSINRAVLLAGYFTDHARIMYRVMAGRSGEADARQVLEALQTLTAEESPVPRWRLHRALRGRRAFARAADLNAPLELLEEYGWIIRTRQPTAGRDREELHLSPHASMAKTPGRTHSEADRYLPGLISMPRRQPDLVPEPLAPTGTDGVWRLEL